MKITLQFTEEEEHRAKMAIDGDSAHYALQEIDEMCRRFVKDNDLTDNVEIFLDNLRECCSDFRIE